MRTSAGALARPCHGQPAGDGAPGGVVPRAHYWVTGVSGTTDIEGTYVRGAHGPRFLHVVLVGA